MRVYLRRRLLEARRTEAEFVETIATYDEINQELQRLLDTWDLREQEQIHKSRRQLQNARAFISRKADGLVQAALEKVLRQWGLVEGASDNDLTNSMSRTPPGADFTNQVSIYLLFSG